MFRGDAKTPTYGEVVAQWRYRGYASPTVIVRYQTQARHSWRSLLLQKRAPGRHPCGNPFTAALAVGCCHVVARVEATVNMSAVALCWRRLPRLAGVRRKGDTSWRAPSTPAGKRRAHRARRVHRTTTNGGVIPRRVGRQGARRRHCRKRRRAVSIDAPVILSSAICAALSTIRTHGSANFRRLAQVSRERPFSSQHVDFRSRRPRNHGLFGACRAPACGLKGGGPNYTAGDKLSATPRRVIT